MTSLEAYRQIFRDTFAATMSDEEILTYAVVLHTHAIAFARSSRSRRTSSATRVGGSSSRH